MLMSMWNLAGVPVVHTPGIFKKCFAIIMDHGCPSWGPMVVPRVHFGTVLFGTLLIEC